MGRLMAVRMESRERSGVGAPERQPPAGTGAGGTEEAAGGAELWSDGDSLTQTSDVSTEAARGRCSVTNPTHDLQGKND